MVGNRVVWGLWILGSVLAGCGGAPFTADDLTEPGALDADAHADGGVPDPLNDSGSDALAADAGVDAHGDADDAVKPDSGATTRDDGGEADASPDGADSGVAAACDSGPLYLHHVGLMGLTWQDCTPTGTYSEAQALAACGVYAAALSMGSECGLRLDPDVCSNSAQYAGVNNTVLWFFSGGRTSADGHVVTVTSDNSCPVSAQDLSWD